MYTFPTVREQSNGAQEREADYLASPDTYIEVRTNKPPLIRKGNLKRSPANNGQKENPAPMGVGNGVEKFYEDFRDVHAANIAETAIEFQARKLSARFGLMIQTAGVIASLAWGVCR